MQSDADVAVFARVGGRLPFAGAGDVFAEADGDQGAGFDYVGRCAAHGTAGADPGYLYGGVNGGWM